MITSNTQHHSRGPYCESYSQIFILAYYNHCCSLRRRLSLVADIVIGCRVGIWQSCVVVFFCQFRRANLIGLRSLSHRWLGMLKQGLLWHIRKLSFFEYSKLLINGEKFLTKPSRRDAVLNQGPFRSAFYEASAIPSELAGPGLKYAC